MAASGGEFVRYWMHNGFVRVQSEKMSKSLGNFITLRDIFGFFLPEVLRFFLLSTHYRSPLDFSWEALKEAEKGLKRIYQTKDQLEQALSRSSWKKTALDPKDRQEAKDIFEQWQASLEDDLNTAAALGHVFNLVRLANRLLEDKAARQSEEGRELFQGCLDNIAELGSILGVFTQESRAFLTSLRDSRAARRQIDTGRVEALLSQRQQARREKDFPQADALREELNAMGVEVQDTPQGPVWDVE
jgi:cysteinyl-tRNA synthetase